MGGTKVLLVMGIVVVGIVYAISAIITLVPYILALIVMLAIARMLIRLSGRSQPVSAEKDETHSPAQTRPGN